MEPVALYYLSEASDGADLSGYNHPATLHGVTYTDGPLGEAGGAVVFDGSITSYGIIENTANTNLIPENSHSVLLQVRTSCYDMLNDLL